MTRKVGDTPKFRSRPLRDAGTALSNWTRASHRGRAPGMSWLIPPGHVVHAKRSAVYGRGRREQGRQPASRLIGCSADASRSGALRQRASQNE